MQCRGLGCSSSFMAVGEHKPVKKIRTKEINPAGMCGNRYFLCYFPRDILALVLGKLTILDYLSFRAVCRCWRWTFLQCQDLFQHQSQEQLPWIVFLKVQKYDWESPILHTTGKIGHSLTRRVYNLDIPELDGSRFLLSKYGWLLLFSTSSESPSRSSLFFLNPFSGSRIDLPFLDVLSLNWPQFSISSSPTSRDCIIFVISICERFSFADVKINILHYGEDAWSTNIYPRGELRVTYPFNAAFIHGTFYCVHKGGELSAYSTSKGSWKRITRPGLLGTRDSKLTTSFPYQYYSSALFCGNMVQNLMVGESERILEARSLIVEETERILEARSLIRETEGIMEARETTILDFNSCLWFAKCEFTEDGTKRIIKTPETIILDLFDLCLWLGDCDFTEDGTKFNWRRLKRWSGRYRGDEDGTSIAWLEPRWIHPALNLRWGA